MVEPVRCPVCEGAYGGRGQFEGETYACTVCGSFTLPQVSLDDYFTAGEGEYAKWNAVRRAALSHAMRTRRNVPVGGNHRPNLRSEVLAQFIAEKTPLPSPAQQAANIIRIVGDYERERGEPLPEPELGFYALVGASSPARSTHLLRELRDKKLVTALDSAGHFGPSFTQAALTLDGWTRWEEEGKGQFATDCGIIAMKFGDAALDAFVKDIVKPAIESIPGLRLERIDDQPEAGIIDNIMRARIRDAPFVLADLTHGNQGAYWEAGYAEGLGKPVIYLCEETVWEERRTHFDTNHSTTVIWNADNPDHFTRTLAATVRKSLKLI